VKGESVRKFILPPGPILILILIGFLLLSAIVYYRAIKIQRFMEPALAISEPRMRFSQNIINLLQEEFGEQESRGIKFRFGSILVDPSLLSDSSHPKESSEPLVLKKLSHVFLTALNNPGIRGNISLIMVSVRLPLSPDAALNRELRSRMQERAALILQSLYAIEPALEKNYGTYFTAAAMPVNATIEETNWIEFRIVPTERLHIEVLQRLEKYAR
jgi:hypothetical protein